MLAAKDQYIDEASKTIFRLSADEQIRKRCLDREEYYLDKMAMERTIEEYHRDKMAMERTMEEYHRDQIAMKKTMEAQNAEIANKNAEIQRLRDELKKLQNPDMYAN